MAKSLKIFTIDNPEEEKILRQRSEEVSIEEIKSTEFKDFLDNLLYTAKHSKEQVGFNSGGIAAPQVGKLLRVFYILNYDTDEFELFINPQVDILKPILTVEKEGCLSIPRLEGKVARYDKVRITYLDKEGNKQRKNFSGWNARGIQHEFDHLEGILFTDKLVD